MLLSHEDLVSELPKLEKLSAYERKKLNDNRRQAQLEQWERKSHGADAETNDVVESHPTKRKKRRLSSGPHFDPGLVLLNCAALCDTDGVRRLLNMGVNPTVYNVDRITPLHQSCLENDESITEMLIEAGCDIDSMDNELWTPLHAAVSLANMECVQLLLQHNANQLSPNVDGQLPIDLCEDKLVLATMEQDLLRKGITQKDLAAARTSQETKFFNEVKQLLEHGGNPNFQLLDNDATLLHVAAANGYVEVALYILSKVCKVDVQDIDGWTPLHAAAFWGEVDIIELLAAHGADFKLRTFCGELPSDLTEDDDIKQLLQRLTERSELMKKHTAVLRPSSVRGRLVSRMTTGEREDKRRESAELHNVFVEQIEKDIAKAPDSWRARTGKYIRPALRDINFDAPLHENIPVKRSSENGMADVKGLERSNAVSESSDYSYQASQSDDILSAICENGEHLKGNSQKRQSKTQAVDKRHTTPVEQQPISVDDSTFELISPSTDTMDSETTWNSNNNNKDSVVCANKAPSLRKEMSFDDLINTEEKDFKGSSSTNIRPNLSRSTSLVESEPRTGHVKRFYSFRTDMQSDGTQRYSPKPNNNKTAYKNKKKAGSSASKHSSADDETLTNSIHSSGEALNSCVVAMNASPKEVDEPVSTPTEPVKEPTSLTCCDGNEAEASSAPGNSMATHAGSLSEGTESAVNQRERGKQEKKSKKCCIIL